jgi:hypothetical protein
MSPFAHVLIVISASYMYPHGNVSMQEFSNEENCRIAEKAIIQQVKPNNPITICVLK